MRHGDYITAHDLMLPIELVASVPTAEPTASFGHVEAKKQAEYQFILEKLRQFGGNRTKTANALGVSTRALRYKLAACENMVLILQSALGSAA